MILISMRASSNVGSISDTSSDEDDEEQEQQSDITPRPLPADVAPPARPARATSTPTPHSDPKSPIDDHNAEASTPTRNFGTEVQRRDEDTEDDIGEDYDADL